MGKKLVLLALIAGFAAIAVFAWQRYQESVKEEERKAQKKPEDAIVVNVVKPERVIEELTRKFGQFGFDISF